MDLELIALIVAILLAGVSGGLGVRAMRPSREIFYRRGQ